MIYTVECAFTDPARENTWNAYYDAEKLEALLSVPGFRAAQRFRAITDTPAPYLAIHSIRDAAVLEQKDYGSVGGGAFGGWDDLVTNWDRNLFTGMEATPEVSAEQFLGSKSPASTARCPGAALPSSTRKPARPWPGRKPVSSRFSSRLRTGAYRGTASITDRAFRRNICAR
jgi:hypothetical protein